MKLISGWSINAGVKFPGTNASWEQSLSGNFWDLTSWEYTNTMSMTDEQEKIYAESGISINKRGLNIRIGTGGTNDIPDLLPKSVNIDSFSDLSWSLTSEINVLNWDQIVELVQCVVAISALVLVGAVLLADDASPSLIGVLNDGYLVPLGAAIGQKISECI